MQFCDICRGYMIKSVTLAGDVVFKCARCDGDRGRKAGKPEDTLMSEKHYKPTEIQMQYTTFISNSTKDPARNVVRLDCPKCGLDFLTLIRIGINNTTMLTCDCGLVIGYDEYKVKVEKNK